MSGRATFDYIVAGAGSAGCVVAARLSEDPSVRVLVLEAGGPDRDLRIRIPAAFSKLFRSEFDWNYTTEPQAHLHGRALYWPRGKTLGGSSSINAQVYIRGHRWDFDHWRELGNAGWGYNDVLPYFLRAEDNQRGASEYHATGGPLAVSDLRAYHPLTKAFVDAAVEAGLPRNPDFNAATQEGAGFFQVTQRNSRRWSAADAYLKPSMSRANLTVRTGAHAARVVVENGRATGVEFIAGGRREAACASREVILSGGAVNSPQLLLLSGIGPAEHLRALGIPVVHDLPGVGENLEDHLVACMGWQCTQPITLDTAGAFKNKVRYLLFRSGPLASNVAEGGVFASSRAGLPAPDLQLLFAPLYYLEHGFRHPPGHGFGIGTTLIRPASRGRIRLRSADPLAHPAIDPNYLAERQDLEALVEGVKLARRIGAGKALAPYRGSEVEPGDEVRTDAEIEEFLRRHAETLYHPTGTCRMGADEMAVVDAELRVRGLAGLRVVDASVMPSIIGGNTNAPTIMIAEKASDLIRGL
jgi:choline dehydrogenase